MEITHMSKFKLETVEKIHQLHGLVASCQFYQLVETYQQVGTNLSISSSFNKPVKIRVDATYHL